MKHILKSAFLFSFAAMFYAGCNSSTTPPSNPVTTTSDSVHYSAGTNYKYTQNARDTNDMVTTGKTDTITSVVLTSNTTYASQSGVTTFENTHSDATVAKDTTYISQTGGNYYHYNYGLESFSQFLGGSAGWVLQAKFAAKAGDAWVSLAPVSVPLAGIAKGVNATVSINATEQADTTIGGKTLKHVTHVITISALGNTFTGKVDTYLDSSLGIVQDDRHSTSIAAPPLFTGKVPGAEVVMIAHP